LFKDGIFPYSKWFVQRQPALVTENRIVLIQLSYKQACIPPEISGLLNPSLGDGFFNIKNLYLIGCLCDATEFWCSGTPNQSPDEYFFTYQQGLFSNVRKNFRFLFVS
jgi:hypothetical protein